MTARKGGFTLVELLIVIMIIAILAGMMMLANSFATDSAEATRIINDLRNLKSAALLYYGDNLKWPTNSDVKSLDQYADRAFTSRYDSVVIGGEYTVDGVTKINIGLVLSDDKVSPSVQNKLASRAADSGLYGTGNVVYTSGTTIYMNMR
ncbi:MAG: type II secretion system GspH family protein [Synergistaceae bacterium]|nr:type II secretion system GspH family protein [Synergistaceae bacterium]